MLKKNKIEGVHMELYKDTYWRGLSKSDYFEGYYTRLVGKKINAAFIFGISYSKDPHGFIQVYDGIKQEMEYFRFSLDECLFAQDHLYVQIGQNILTDTTFYLNLQGTKMSFTIDVQFSTFRTLKDTGYKSIMGPLLHLPRLECYHGVVSMYHTWSGQVNTQSLSGYSYIEKDYGKSMPTDWVWLHLTDTTGVSFMLSIAKVPYLGWKPTGFLGFYSEDEQTDVFASYTRATYEIEKLNNTTIQLIVKTQKKDYYLMIQRKQTVYLKAPVGGMMVREIEESLASEGTLTIKTKKGIFIAKHHFSNVGCEVVGSAFLKE